MHPGQVFNPWRMFHGALVPARILSSIQLPARAKLLYGQLCRYAGKRGYCWPHQSKLAEDLQVSERTIRRGIAALEAAGLIRARRSPRPAAGNVYEFLWKSLWETDQLTLPFRPEMAGLLRPEMAGPISEEESQEKKSQNHNTDHCRRLEVGTVEKLAAVVDASAKISQKSPKLPATEKAQAKMHTETKPAIAPKRADAGALATHNQFSRPATSDPAGNSLERLYGDLAALARRRNLANLRPVRLTPRDLDIARALGPPDKRAEV